jgi:hypothetical protein
MLQYHSPTPLIAHRQDITGAEATLCAGQPTMAIDDRGPRNKLPGMSAITHAELAQFTSSLKYRLKLLDQTRVHTDRFLATRFNIFDYLEPNENLLSDIIADLVDPTGTHGQGDIFLKELLSLICKDVQPAWKSCAVNREDLTTFIDSNRRRIDVLIDFGNRGIAIENKPWAPEQKDQVGDYVSHLRRKFGGNFTIVYLSRDGSEPTSLKAALKKQLVNENKLLLVAYRGSFYDWLLSCQKNCMAEKIRSFLGDFMNYIDQQLVGARQEIKDHG